MVEEQQKRQTARKLCVRDILDSTYVKEDGLKPNHIVLRDNSTAARVNLLGVVVSSASEGFPAITVDDGTGRISIRAFEPDSRISYIQIGDVVLVIGRPRQFGSEMYLLPEIVRKIPDLGWIEVRKLELSKKPVITGVQTTPQQEVVTEEVIDESVMLSERIMNAIRLLDEGDGAEIEAVIEHVKDENVEKKIQFLLQSGNVFEVSPGRLKVLE